MTLYVLKLYLHNKCIDNGYELHSKNLTLIDLIDGYKPMMNTANVFCHKCQLRQMFLNYSTMNNTYQDIKKQNSKPYHFQ